MPEAGRRTQDLLKLEQHVFGSTDAASPVKLRVPRQPQPSPAGELDWPGNADSDGPWYAYLLGQGLTKLVRKEDRGRRQGSPYSCHAQRPYVAAGATFSVQFRFDKAEEDRAAVVLASLWLLCAYGGLGARVRRGLGGIRITDVDGDLPNPWTAESLRTPGLSFYESRYPDTRSLWVPDVVGPSMQKLIQIARDDVKVRFDPQAVSDEGPPLYPTFSRQFAIAALSGGKTFPGWPAVFAEAGEELRWFRARSDNDCDDGSTPPRAGSDPMQRPALVPSG